MDVREALGRAVGGILAPLAAEASLTRGAPMLHADGVLLRAEVVGTGAGEPLERLGKALGGAALVRFSGAVQRYRVGRDPRDVFGAAIRFGSGTKHPQDLLFATFRRVWEMPFAPLLTNPRDFLANAYHTVLPFHVPGTGTLFTFRLVPEPQATEGRDHVDRLERAVAVGEAILHLEARSVGAHAPYGRIASITLRERIAPERVGASHLRFNPLRDGAGIVPAGFLQAVRAAVYPASQLGARLAEGPGEGE